MEIGTEISQKVRSAIKAKLVDLGAYVDDELPDYIMVMVANRKTTDQMTDDLNLFLGNNTLKFTAWLSALLDKLQLIADKEEADKAARQKAESAPISPEAAPEPPASVPLAESVATRHDGAVDTKRARVLPVSDQTAPAKKVERTSISTIDTGRKRSASDSRSTPNVNSQGSKKARTATIEQESTNNDKPVESAVVPDIELAAENEMLFEEESEEVPKKKGGPVVQHIIGVKPSDTRSGNESRGRTTREVPSTKRTARANDSPPSPTKTSRASVKSRLGESTEHSTSGSANRKHRPLTSTIGAVVTHPSLDVEEEQYDPYRPAIGKVASQVKVTERKSKVPSTWQADKSILLKAVNAAQTSIEKSSTRREKAIVRPVSRRDSSPKRHRSSAHRLRRSPSPSSAHRLRRSPSPSSAHRLRRSPSPRRGMRSDRSYKSTSRSASSRHRDSDRGTGERKIQVFSRSKDDEALLRLRSKVMDRRQLDVEEAKTKETEQTVKTEVISDTEKSDKEEQSVSIADEDVLDLVLPEDQRLIEYDSEEDLKPELTVPAYRATPIRRPVRTLVESGAEDSDFTDGEGDDSRVVRQHERRLAERAESPKFVVTLDGVDPVLLKTDVKFDSESDNEQSVILAQPPPKPERNIVRVEPRPHRPMVQPITMVNLGEDEEYDGADSVMTEDSTKPSSPEKCHFWPACRNGEACPYFHPTEPCRNFPICKFADKCLYVHPDCKFDAQCTKPECPFTHSKKKHMSAFPQSLPVFVQPIKVPVFAGGFYPPTRPSRAPAAPAAKHPSQVTCKFFPRCTNMNCVFNHPKPCRFGVSCNNKATCIFSHPKLPTKDQMTWSTKPAQLTDGSLPSLDMSPVVSPSQPLCSTPTT